MPHQIDQTERKMAISFPDLKHTKKNLLKVRHVIEGNTLTREIRSSLGRGMLLTNKAGGYYSTGAKTKSNGLFFRLDGRLYKILDSMTTPGEIKSVTNNFWSLETKKPHFSERFFMPLYTNTLVYELSAPAPVDLFLDMREADDYRSAGRAHKITIGKNLVLVEYTKSGDTSEESARHGYHLYLAIAGESFLHREKIGKWVKVEYELDRQLGQPPFESQVYHAIRLFSRKMVLSASLSRKEAIDHAKKVFQDLPRLSEIQRQYLGITLRRTGRKDIDAAHKAAANSLDALSFKQENQLHIYDGLPFSPRQSGLAETISLKALIQDGRLEASKEIIMRQLDEIEKNPQAADIALLGWYLKRWADLITLLSEKGIYQEHLRGEEIERITKRLEKIVDSTLHSCADEEGFAIAGPNQSWMSSIERPGPRIELQAMRLATYHLMYKLTLNEEYLQKELELKKKVLDRFWNGKYLKDGLNDGTIRPNLFIAAYLYPDLLMKKEWETCFSHVLTRLWSDKAGILTLDKTSSFYSKQYHPKEPATKYNGPPHFWLNNLAAIAMHTISPIRFMGKINRLAAISTRDILWKGAVNTPSEFTNADRLTTEGNLCSALSAATYIELVHEIYLKRK